MTDGKILTFKAKAQATDAATKQRVYSELLAVVSIRALDRRWAALAFRERFNEAPGEDLLAIKLAPRVETMMFLRTVRAAWADRRDRPDDAAIERLGLDQASDANFCREADARAEAEWAWFNQKPVTDFDFVPAPPFVPERPKLVAGTGSWIARNLSDPTEAKARA